MRRLKSTPVIILSIKIKMGCLNWHPMLSCSVHNFCGNEAFMQLNHAVKRAFPPPLIPAYMLLLTPSNLLHECQKHLVAFQGGRGRHTLYLLRNKSSMFLLATNC